MCLVACINDKLHPFFLLFTIKPAVGMVEDLSVHNKMHAFHGEVIQGNATLVHLPDDYFNQATQFQVPTLLNAKALLAADATNTSFGPFLAGEVDTIAARTRKACVLHAKYAGYFLSHEEGGKPRQFLEEL